MIQNLFNNVGLLLELFYFVTTAALNMSPQVIRITKPLEMGEGPHWDCNAKALYFVDMHYSEIHKYVPETNLHTYGVVEGTDGRKPVTFVIPVEGKSDTFLIGYGGDLATVQWDGISNHTKNLQIIAKLEEQYPKVRLNDGKASPSGVVFAGSMGTKQDDGSFPPRDGNLFVYTQHKSKCLLQGVGISNGLAWSLDESIFYYVDSLSGQVKAYDYDSKLVSLSNERVIYDFAENNVFDPPTVIPDGITIDISGNLWVSVIGSSKVFHINPKTSCVISTIEFPCTRVTSVAFGGPSLEDLFVTSAYLDLTEEQKKEQQNAGCLFRVTGLGTKGLPGVSAKLC